jgi:ferric iron reductase protein FhuF
VNREIGLLNLMNTPEHCSAPFHSVSSKVAKSTKMAAAHIQTYVLHVTWSILYTYLIITNYIYIYIYYNQYITTNHNDSHGLYIHIYHIDYHGFSTHGQLNP